MSFDVAWSPNCIDKRCYDHVAIAESCDLLFVMSYDEQSQIFGDCIAMANAPVSQTIKGTPSPCMDVLSVAEAKLVTHLTGNLVHRFFFLQATTSIWI